MKKQNRKGKWLAILVPVAVVLIWILGLWFWNWVVLGIVAHFVTGAIIWQIQCLIGLVVSLMWTSGYWAAILNIGVWGSLLGLGGITAYLTFSRK